MRSLFNNVAQVALLCLVSIAASAEADNTPRSLDDNLRDYSIAWTTTNPEHRLALLTASVSADVVYRDPQTDAAGIQIQSITDLHNWIGQFLTDMGNYGLLPVKNEFSTNIDHRKAHPDSNAELVRFGWKLSAFDGGYLIADGEDFIETHEDGKIAIITGFFGPLLETCSEAAWENKTYLGGNKVTHNNSTWKAKWWTQEEPGSVLTEQSVWTNLGACSPNQ